MFLFLCVSHSNLDESQSPMLSKRSHFKVLPTSCIIALYNILKKANYISGCQGLGLWDSIKEFGQMMKLCIMIRVVDTPIYPLDDIYKTAYCKIVL